MFALVLQSIATQVKWHALRFMNALCQNYCCRFSLQHVDASFFQLGACFEKPCLPNFYMCCQEHTVCVFHQLCVCVLIFVIFFLLHAEGVTTNTLLRMETGLLYTRVDTGSSLLCFYREASRLKPGMCDSANLSS